MKVEILYKTSTKLFSTSYQFVFAIPSNIIIPHKYTEFLRHSVPPDFKGEVDFKCQYIIPNTTNPLELLRIYGELCSICEKEDLYNNAYLTYSPKVILPYYNGDSYYYDYRGWLNNELLKEGYINVLLPKNKRWSKMVVVDRSKEDLIAGLDITRFDVIDKYGGVKFKFSDLPKLAKEFEEDLGYKHETTE